VQFSSSNITLLDSIPLKLSQTIAVALLAVVELASIANAQLLRTVALSGQSALGAGLGVTFSSFDSFPVINDDGIMAFEASINGLPNGSGSSLWRSSNSSTLQLIAKSGDIGPGPDGGHTFTSFMSTAISSDGNVLFYDVHSGEITGLWRMTNVLQSISHVGGAAPGTSAGVVFQGIASGYSSDTGAPFVTTGGRSAFIGRLAGPGVDSSNDVGLWYVDENGTPSLIARSGDPAPGLGTDVFFGGFEGGFDSANIGTTLNEEGSLAFVSSLTGSAVGSSNHSLWRYDQSSGLTLVAREDQPVPGASGSLYHGFGTPVLNARGDIAYYGSIKGNLNGGVIMASREETGITVLYRPGDPAPGTGTEFLYFNATGTAGDLGGDATSPIMNQSGLLAFHGGLKGGGSVNTSNDFGIWAETAPGELALVAREGDRPPGVEANITFGTFERVMPSMNALGQVAFVAPMNPSRPDGGHNIGLWAQDAEGTLHLIVREGGVLDVDPGPAIDLRTVSTLRALGYGNSGNEDGRASAFNDYGQLAFSATFTDGASGVFVSNLVASLPQLPGDFDDDGDVDGRDFLLWQRNPSVGDIADWQANYWQGNTSTTPGDFDLDGDVDGRDFLLWQRNSAIGDLADWQSNYGNETLAAATAVPEPSSFAVFTLAMISFMVFRLPPFAFPLPPSTFLPSVQKYLLTMLRKSR
jgi:hypothetical protein